METYGEPVRFKSTNRNYYWQGKNGKNIGLVMNAKEGCIYEKKTKDFCNYHNSELFALCVGGSNKSRYYLELFQEQRVL